MRDAFDDGDLDQLKVLAHQLKGAAGSYGFGPISVVCSQLEKVVLEGAPSETILAAIARVADFCERATHLPD